MDYHLGSKKLRVEHYVMGKQLILLSKISFFVTNLIKVDRCFLSRCHQMSQVIFKLLSGLDRIWAFWLQFSIYVQDHAF